LGILVSAIQSDHPRVQGQQLDVSASNTQKGEGSTLAKRTQEELTRLKIGFGRFGFAVAVAGLTLAASETVWAVLVGVSYPIAIAAAYCTFAASVCLGIAVAVALKSEAPKEQPIAQNPALSGAWKLANTFSVSDACRLMCAIEPGSMVTQDCIAWARALLEAIERGELPVVEKAQGGGMLPQRRAQADWHSEVTREALKSWTQLRGTSPQFLQD
jgi:hypothetical protein